MSLFEHQATEFQRRHIGPSEEQLQQMLAAVGANDLEDLVSKTVPPGIRMQQPLALPPALSES